MKKKYQHEETDKPTKHHVYSKIITKCKFHITHKPQNRNHSEKNVSAERQYLQNSNHTHNSTKKNKNAKTVVSTWQQN